MRPPLFLALTGPTASGKTALSLDVAAALGAEIVSMDSRQVYRGMDVGTAKATAEERRRVRHHLLDLVDPDTSYSAGRFAREAGRAIQEIRARGRLPLLVGGTGFFLRALMEPIFEEPYLEPPRLLRLRSWIRHLPLAKLEAWVRVLDPSRADLAAAGGPQRLGRTVEVALLTGRPLSWWHREAGREGKGPPGLVVLLELPREVLYRRIDARVDRMVDAGLVDEVRTLLEAGYEPDDPGMTGAGYGEVAAHLRGELTLEEAKERIRRATRSYSRRQLTWFRNQLPEETVRVDGTLPRAEQLGVVVDAWRSREAG